MSDTDQPQIAATEAAMMTDAKEADMHPDQQALHLTYDAYVAQGMEDHEHGSLRPDDFITRLLNAGVVVRMADWYIENHTSQDAAAPPSGQVCVRKQAADAGARACYRIAKDVDPCHRYPYHRDHWLVMGDELRAALKGADR